MKLNVKKWEKACSFNVRVCVMREGKEISVFVREKKGSRRERERVLRE